MPVVNVLDKRSVKNGDKVVVTKTIEEHLTRQDLLQAKQNLGYQKQNLLQQQDNINKQIVAINEQDKELDDLMKMLEVE